ncbi:hypothetical protein TNCV_4287551 [Trichonephila clavipes]|uniref:Uncharacterized protein n=1 Tax=Trichonephila clavipes TaxID=2585209 RepID=A0A8X6VCR7_TRICX|nr:hypothetical protein TNCV_4287551 [Trichonephila clavipes]
MHNATVQQPLTTVSPNSNAAFMMLQAKAEFISKHNVVPFRCPSPLSIEPLVAQMPVVSSQGRRKVLTSDDKPRNFELRSSNDFPTFSSQLCEDLKLLWN